VRVTFPPHVHLQVAAFGGRLKADGGDAEDRDVAEIGVDAGYRTLPWLTLAAGVTTRTYTSPLARQRWTALRIGAEARLGLLDGRVEGIGQFVLLPVVAVSGLDQPDLAYSTAAGIEYHVGPLGVGLCYALERYDFPTRDGVSRDEQLSSLQLYASARLVRF